MVVSKVKMQRALSAIAILVCVPLRTGGQGASPTNCENSYAANVSMSFEIVAIPGATHVSDGLGPYLDDRKTCTAVRDETEGFFAFGAPNRREWEECTGKAFRSWTTDLSKPVAGGGGLDRGKLSSPSMHVRFITRRDAQGKFVGLRDLAVGDSLDALYLRVVDELNGNLQLIFAPKPTGCVGYTQADGSTAARVRRASASLWEVDIPQGSIGRLKTPAGRRGGAPSLIDHGLYGFTARYRIRSVR
jgi:hypothetical protein